MDPSTPITTTQWLNDEVINLYISLLLERDAARRTQVRHSTAQCPAVLACMGLLACRQSFSCSTTRLLRLLARCSPPQGAGGPRCHFFSTFFANKLYKDGGYDYNAVSAGQCMGRYEAVPGQAHARVWHAALAPQQVTPS